MRDAGHMQECHAVFCSLTLVDNMYEVGRRGERGAKLELQQRSISLPLLSSNCSVPQAVNQVAEFDEQYLYVVLRISW